MNYRFATPDDHVFILSGWSSSLRMTRDIPFIPMARGREELRLPEAVLEWATVMRPVLEYALARSTCIVVEGEVLAGFIAFEPRDLEAWPRQDFGYVLYCYVAQPFRGRGFARGLFRAAAIDPSTRFTYACRTRASWECRDKFPNATYDPFRARYPKEKCDV